MAHRYTIKSKPKTFYELLGNVNFTYVTFTDITFLTLPFPFLTSTGIKAHKAILAAASPLFAKMFFPHGKLPTPIETIWIRDVTKRHFNGMIEYIYGCNLTFDGLWSACYMYSLAMVFKLPDLRKECVDIIELMLKDPEVDKSIIWLAYDAALCLEEDKELLDKWFQIIKSNTQDVLRSIRFQEVRWNTLDSILSCETLACTELDLFEAVKQWRSSHRSQKAGHSLQNSFYKTKK